EVLEVVGLGIEAAVGALDDECGGQELPQTRLVVARHESDELLRELRGGLVGILDLRRLRRGGKRGRGQYQQQHDSREDTANWSSDHPRDTTGARGEPSGSEGAFRKPFSEPLRRAPEEPRQA